MEPTVEREPKRRSRLDSDQRRARILDPIEVATGVPMQRNAGEEFDVRRCLSGLGSQLAGVANVIMQLSWPGVGYGVMESRVESGSAMKHPVKRARTTFTYLAVALLGDEEDRRVYRKAVNGQHAQVRSTASSPVAYSALDSRLQMWVAACLYYGMADLLERRHGPLDPVTADHLYAYSARLGTSLQVPDEMWPANRTEFARYWEKSLAEVHIDGAVSEYLLSLVRLENLPRPVRLLLARRNEFWARGFLPPMFREQMGLTWSSTEEVEFNRRLRRLGRLEDLLPTPVRIFPFNVLLWDMRRRQRQGRPLV